MRKIGVNVLANEMEKEPSDRIMEFLWFGC